MSIMLFGAGGSIGQALYKGLTENDAEVYGVSPEGPDDFVRYGELQTKYDEELVEESFARYCNKHLSPPEIVICNVGATHIDPLEEYDGARFQNVMYLNCVVPFMIARQYTLLWRGWRAQYPILSGALPERGRMIFTCSMAASRPMRQCYAYPASKAAEIMMLKSFAREFSGPEPGGIDFFGVSPCSIEGTNLIAYSDRKMAELRGWSQEQAEKYTRSHYPIGRLAEMDELMRVFRFACFDAPTAMSGTVLEMSAGGN